MDKQFEHRNYHWPQPPLECAPATVSQSQQNLLPQQQHQLLPYEPAQGTSHFVPPQHMYHLMSNQQSQPFSAPQQQPSYAVNRGESRIDNHQPASKEAEIQKFVQEQENMRAYMHRILDRNTNLGNENLELQNTNQLLHDTTVSKDEFDKVAEEAVQKSKQLDDLKERLQQEKNKGLIKDLNNSQLKDKLASAENNLKILSEKEEVLEKENEELRNTVANFKAKESNHEREVKKFKKDQKGLMQDWKDYDIDKTKLEEDQKAMEERERKLESDRNEFNIRVAKYETDKRQLDAARELEFNTEMQKLEEERKNIANQKDTHSEKVKKDKQILADEKFKHMKNVNELRTAKQKLGKKEKKVEGERKELMKKSNKIIAERKDFLEKIVQLETDKRNLANDVNNLQEEKQTLLQQVEKLEADTQGLKSNVGNVQQKLQSETETTELLKGQVQELTRKARYLEMANNALKNQNSENQEEINNLMEQLRNTTKLLEFVD